MKETFPQGRGECQEGLTDGRHHVGTETYLPQKHRPSARDLFSRRAEGPGALYQQPRGSRLDHPVESPY